MSDSSLQGARRRKRIPALDFWRGVFLMMIYINHVPDNPFSKITLRNWGFSDSAEAFIFISGFSAMLAFGPYFETGGWAAGLLRVLRRVWQLFCAHVLLVFGLSAMVAVASDFMESRQIMEQFNFSPFFVETNVAIVKLLKLGYLPNLADILPLYIVLVFLFPVAWGLARVSSVLALCASFALWLWVNATGFFVPNYPDGAQWFFNPFAWQILFVAGMVTYKNLTWVRAACRTKFVFWAAGAVAVVSILIIEPWANFEALSTWRLFPAEWIPADNKMNLSWLRIVHFLAFAVLGSRLVQRRKTLWENRFVQAISLCGRHSLAVFCAGTGLSLLVHIFLSMGGDQGVWGAVALVLGGLLMLVFLAFVLEAGSSFLKRVEKTRATGLLSVEKV